jgi:FkbM family methyltransferase
MAVVRLSCISVWTSISSREHGTTGNETDLNPQKDSSMNLLKKMLLKLKDRKNRKENRLAARIADRLIEIDGRSAIPYVDNTVLTETDLEETGGGSVRPCVYIGDNTVLTETDFNRKIYLDSSDVSIAPHIMWQGNWEPWLTEFLVKELCPEDNFFDIGANCGYFSILAAHYIGRAGAVVAVEPQKKLSQKIQRSFFVNGFDGNSKVYQLALGSESGTADLHKNDFLSGSASICGLSSFTDSVEKVSIEPLSEVVRRASEEIGREILPTVIKIDTEGFEILAWEGSRDIYARCDKLLICLEFSPSRYTEMGRDPQEFLSMIREDGFKIFVLNHDGQVIPVEGKIEEQILMPSGHSDLVLRKNR